MTGEDSEQMIARMMHSCRLESSTNRKRFATNADLANSILWETTPRFFVGEKDRVVKFKYWLLTALALAYSVRGHTKNRICELCQTCECIIILHLSVLNILTDIYQFSFFRITNYTLRRYPPKISLVGVGECHKLRGKL